MVYQFQKLFTEKKPIIGMIHLAGDSFNEKIDRAIEELRIYEEEGLSGAIVEDYHAGSQDFLRALDTISKKNLGIKIGVNWLRNPEKVLLLADATGASFVQLDAIRGSLKNYEKQRAKFPNLVVLGGVRFKYQQESRKSLEEDIAEGISRFDAIVTTGSGTGIETPIEKLIKFKRILGDYPLVIGAGVNNSNVHEQLKVANAAIIGSYFKINNNTYNQVDRSKVKDLMYIVQEIRRELQ